MRVPSDGVPAFEVDVPTDMDGHLDQTGCMVLKPHEGQEKMEMCILDISDTPDASVDQLGPKFVAGFGAGATAKSAWDSVDEHEGRRFDSEPLPNGMMLSVTVVKLDRKNAFIAALIHPASAVSFSALALDEVLIRHVRLIGAN